MESLKQANTLSADLIQAIGNAMEDSKSMGTETESALLHIQLMDLLETASKVNSRLALLNTTCN